MYFVKHIINTIAVHGVFLFCCEMRLEYIVFHLDELYNDCPIYA